MEIFILIITTSTLWGIIISRFYITEEILKSDTVIATICFIVSLITFGSYYYKKEFGFSTKEKNRIEVEKVEKEITEEKVDKKFKHYFIEHIQNSNIQYKELTIKQALLETGHFSSNIFSENNNCFGMKHPKRRETTSLGMKNNHAYYKDWIHSVKDFELWQQDFINRNKITDSLQYVKRLNEVYSENLQYIELLNKIKI